MEIEKIENDAVVKIKVGNADFGWVVPSDHSLKTMTNNIDGSINAVLGAMLHKMAKEEELTMKDCQLYIQTALSVRRTINPTQPPEPPPEEVWGDDNKKLGSEVYD